MVGRWGDVERVNAKAEKCPCSATLDTNSFISNNIVRASIITCIPTSLAWSWEKLCFLWFGVIICGHPTRDFIYLKDICANYRIKTNGKLGHMRNKRSLASPLDIQRSSPGVWCLVNVVRCCAPVSGGLQVWPWDPSLPWKRQKKKKISVGFQMFVKLWKLCSGDFQGSWTLETWGFLQWGLQRGPCVIQCVAFPLPPTNTVVSPTGTARADQLNRSHLSANHARIQLQASDPVTHASYCPSLVAYSLFCLFVEVTYVKRAT